MVYDEVITSEDTSSDVLTSRESCCPHRAEGIKGKHTPESLNSATREGKVHGHAAVAKGGLSNIKY